MSETGPRPACRSLRHGSLLYGLERSKRGPTVHYEPSSGRANVSAGWKALAPQAPASWGQRQQDELPDIAPDACQDGCVNKGPLSHAEAHQDHDYRGHDLPDPHRDLRRRDRPWSEDHRRDRQAARGGLAGGHDRRVGGGQCVGDRAAVADLLRRGAACPARARPEGGRRARSQRARQASCLCAAQDQDPEHAEPRRHRGMSVAVVRFDDLWQIGFEIERIEGGKVALFLPGSPDPWSGSVCIAEADRVTPLDLPVAAVVKMVRRLGRGANEALGERLRRNLARCEAPQIQASAACARGSCLGS